MYDEKPWYASKTIWGIGVALTTVIVAMATNWWPLDTITIGALVFALYGRLVATDQIS